MSNWRNGSTTPRTPQQLELAAAVTPFAAGLPGLPDAIYPAGALFVQTPSMLLWQSTGAAWVAVTPAQHGASHAPNGTDEVLDLREAIRDQRLLRLLGYEDENGPFMCANASSVAGSGRVYVTCSYHFAGEPINGYIMAVNTIPVGCTLAKVGIWNAAGVLLRGSANENGQLGTTGKKKFPLTSQLLIPSDGFYWRGWLNVAGTGTALMRLNGGSGANGAVPGVTLAHEGNMDAQVDLPANLVVQSGGNAFGYWMARY